MVWKIRQATVKGYAECEVGGVADLSYPTSKTRRGRVQMGGRICPALTAMEGEFYQMNEELYQIRKLTPKEYFRLMGFCPRNEDGSFDDECFEKAQAVCSNTQLYKQAGNSIVVNCIEEILINLFKKG